MSMQLSPSFSGPPPSLVGSHQDGDVLAVLEGRCVLVVEDEVLIAFELRHALEEMGAEVVHARTLRAALRYGMSGFDAAILDVSLGNETCAEVAMRLREARTPFLLHSGDLDRQGELVASLRAPIVAKPAAMTDVVAAVAALIRDAEKTLH